VPDRSVLDRSVLDRSVEVSAMSWEAPDFSEVRMDAEINSYQDDFDREPDDRF
jgi:coenzyme PQQ precursor peptide PqqA